ncbi:apelin receptor B [Pleuronectes platessa]|uniref:apelin receptor B n=1 Tax=Pleuronectes platessa TaxID=8262 RepID=UPI00232A3A02|nr:apelin receptor B [Pleuronectes platessa]XP_053299094.1 apelin receptor B [Pleuronectes platessa]XP_053299095.1 apelin receptor B [Pleuronectes platessa]XP_053299096.1 apelin receptor B [Pleuronectes platessa]XP_053299097.1 apelin receptor B [Pleuronectes platessa]XP_053299098.1 apelin receptor B [Pleuronectes platessa]
MVLMEEGNVSCGVKNCSTPGFWRNCSNQDCQEEETMAASILLVIIISLMLFGLVGNTLTLLVVWLRPNMRSSAHLYLSNMAVSDLLILLLLALDVLKIWTGWKLGVIVCKLSTFLTEGCIFCTILNITFLSLERYLVVCWPITSKTLVTRRRTRTLIGCLWLGAAVSAAPFLVMMEVDEMEECRVSPSSFSSGLVLAMIILYYLYVLVPLCILGLVYILIGRTLRLRPQRSRKDKSHRHTVKMLGVIFLAFVLCWLPYIVALTMTYVSLGTGAESRGTNTDTNTHSDMNTPPESTGNMASVTEPVSLSDWDLKTQAHTNRDDALWENTNNEIDTHSDADAHLVDTQPETLTDPGTGSDDTNAHHVVSHDIRAGESTHNVGTRTETDTHSEIHNTTHNKQNPALCIKSQKVTQYFYLVAWFLSRLSAAINPLVYNLMSARYRHAVCSLLHTHCLTPSH